MPSPKNINRITLTKILLFIFFNLSIFIHTNTAVGQQLITDQKDFEIIHYDMKINFDTENSIIFFSTDIKFKSLIDQLKEIVLILNKDYRVELVKREDVELKYFFKKFILPGSFEYLGLYLRGVRIPLDKPMNKNEEFILTIQYSGTPESLFSFISSEFIELNPESRWYPTTLFEKGRYTATISTVLPANQVPVIIGGYLEKTIKEKNKTIYDWNIKEPTDCFHLLSGRYKKFSKKSSGTLYEVYILEEHKQAVSKFFDYCIFSIKVYQDWFGKIPIKRYMIAERVLGGGGNFGFTHGIVIHKSRIEELIKNKDSISTFGVVAHEIAHKWWGNLIMRKSTPRDLILDEGLAEYSRLLAVKKKFGQPKMNKILKDTLKEHQKYVDNAGDREVAIVNPYAPVSLAYEKGCLFFRMLHYITGKKFFEISKNYVKKYKNKYASVEDLQSVALETYGKKIEQFFYDFLKTTEKLDYAISNVNSIKTKSGYSTTFTISSIGEIQMPLDIEILLKTNRQEIIKKIKLTESIQTFTFNTKEEILSITIDPDYWLLDINRNNNSYGE